MKKQVLGGAFGLLLFTGLCVFIYILTNNKVSAGYNEGYEPVQPIPYSHKLHAGRLGIDCKYCHVTAEVSRHASVPSLNICMNCHMLVRQVGGKDSPHIAKLVKAFENNEPILWERVHLLPDFVRFNHAPHIKAGKQCQECHGPIEEMDVVKQWSTLSMGWCVNCHREPHNNASVNCSACHY